MKKIKMKLKRSKNTLNRKGSKREDKKKTVKDRKGERH